MPSRPSAFRSLATALLAASFAAGALAQTGVTYTESIHGDLSNDRLHPTPLSLAPGANTISGAFGRSPVPDVPDLDYLTVTIPAGSQLSSLVLLNANVGGAYSFIGVHPGAQVSIPYTTSNPAPLLGWTHFGNADQGQDILPAIGAGAGAQHFTPPLPAGTYTFWIMELDTAESRSYSFQFNLTAAPPPPPPPPPAAYLDTILVANDASYDPLVLVDPLVSNGWGIAIRPPGAGGHFWISNFNTGTTTTYVGDVHAPPPDGRFTPLFQDALRVVTIPVGAGLRIDGAPTAPVPQVTGQVFNHSMTDFVVSGEGITGASRFIFVTGEGTISGWVEQRDAQGNVHRQTRSVITVDQSQEFDDDRLRYTGCAVTDFPSGNRLYVTNFTTNQVEVYDHQFQRVPTPPSAFRYPGQPDDYVAWNIQFIRTGPNADGHLWVAYALREEPWEEDCCNGAVAQFDRDGNFIRRLQVRLDADPLADNDLRAPWGLAVAPPNFGPHSNHMLVANFGDGSIAAFDLESGRFVDFLRNPDGSPLLVDGIWGLTFGNGVALGDTDALYYAAGPNGEIDGTFGTVRYIPSTCPTIERQPASLSLCGSIPLTLDLHAPAPVRIAFQWQVERAAGQWSDLADGPSASGSEVTGATSPRLTITNPAPADALAYRCILANACGSLTSEPARIINCPADFNCDARINSADFFAFLAALFKSNPAADINRDGVVNSQDFFAFLLTFFNDC